MTQATSLPVLKNFLDDQRVPGDFWGGLAAMLVALPAAIAFGVTIYAVIGPSYAATGALAGMIGAVVIGLLAAILGGTDRLISAPCAPAVAVLVAFTFTLVQQHTDPNIIILLLMVLGILTGILQMLFGFIGIGRLIKYAPYPVISGFLSAVGLLIIASQLPKFIGISSEAPWHKLLFEPWLWDLRSVAIGAVTVIVGEITPRLTNRVPGTILGILAGHPHLFRLCQPGCRPALTGQQSAGHRAFRYRH